MTTAALWTSPAGARTLRLTSPPSSSRSSGRAPTAPSARPPAVGLWKDEVSSKRGLVSLASSSITPGSRPRSDGYYGLCIKAGAVRHRPPGARSKPSRPSTPSSSTEWLSDTAEGPTAGRCSPTVNLDGTSGKSSVCDSAASPEAGQPYGGSSMRRLTRSVLTAGLSLTSLLGFMLPAHAQRLTASKGAEPRTCSAADVAVGSCSWFVVPAGSNLAVKKADASARMGKGSATTTPSYTPPGPTVPNNNPTTDGVGTITDAYHLKIVNDVFEYGYCTSACTSVGKLQFNWNWAIFQIGDAGTQLDGSMRVLAGPTVSYPTSTC